MNRSTRLMTFALATVAVSGALAGCRSRGELVIDEGVGVTAVRSACPAVGIPDYTGDVTLMRSGGGTTADDIDVVATMTNVRSTCNEGARDGSGKVFSAATFDVLARRSDARGARQVVLPYFITVLRGGSEVSSKRVGQVVLNFADGQERAKASGQGSAYIDRAQATLPQEIRERLVRKRRAGDADAAVDPLTEPDVKAAVTRATFELLLGFQLDDAQLAANVRR